MKINKILALFLCCTLLTATGCSSSKKSSNSEDDSTYKNMSSTTVAPISSNNEDAQHTYPISSLGSTSGFFKLSSLGDKITHFWNECGHSRVAKFNGENYGYLYDEGAYLCTDDKSLMDLNISGGEKMIIVETENNYQLSSLNLYPISLIGYSNEAVLKKSMPQTIDKINDVDISSVKGNLDALNNAISKTGVKYYPYETTQGYKYGVFLTNNKNSMFTYSYYEGTKYMHEEAEMYYSYYLAPLKNKLKVPIKKTENGYFVVDLSSVPKGEYLIYEEYYGWYLVNIK